MTNTPHQLVEDFPDYADRISVLKAANPRFAKIYEEYHDVNRAIHRAEVEVEPVCDEYMDDMRKTRMSLKDELYAMLRAD